MKPAEERQEENLVLRFISSITNLFTQDLVLSEQLLWANSLKYVTVFANRSTKQEKMEAKSQSQIERSLSSHG